MKKIGIAHKHNVKFLLVIFPKMKALAGAFYPFMTLREPKFIDREDIMVHELIHFKQQQEMLIIFFYLWYGIEWCWHAAFMGSFEKSQKLISFEVEAYDNENNTGYLQNRKHYSFIKYV